MSMSDNLGLDFLAVPDKPNIRKSSWMRRDPLLLRKIKRQREKKKGNRSKGLIALTPECS